MTVTAMPKNDPDSTAGKAGKGKAPRSKVKTILIAVVVLLALGGGGYFVMKPSKPGPPQPGIVDRLDPIQINLAGGHYLRLALALQLKVGAPDDLDGSKALDKAIDVFSGQQMADLNQGQIRDKLKKQLGVDVGRLYDGDVLAVYFTEFVTQ